MEKEMEVQQIIWINLAVRMQSFDLLLKSYILEAFMTPPTLLQKHLSNILYLNIIPQTMHILANILYF